MTERGMDHRSLHRLRDFTGGLRRSPQLRRPEYHHLLRDDGRLDRDEQLRIFATLLPPQNRSSVARFALMLTLSVTIAVMGLAANSTAVVIGAMLIAPLMTPIMTFSASVGLGFGQTGDPGRVSRRGRHRLVGGLCRDPGQAASDGHDRLRTAGAHSPGCPRPGRGDRGRSGRGVRDGALRRLGRSAGRRRSGRPGAAIGSDWGTARGAPQGARRGFGAVVRHQPSGDHHQCLGGAVGHGGGPDDPPVSAELTDRADCGWSHRGNGGGCDSADGALARCGGFVASAIGDRSGSHRVARRSSSRRELDHPRRAGPSRSR